MSAAPSPLKGSTIFAAANLRDHVPGIRKGQRRNTKDDVFDNLRQYTADPEHDAHAELRVSHQSADDFPASFNHFLDQQGFTTWNLQEDVHLLFSLLPRPEVKGHPSHLGLVREARPRCLQHNGKPDFCRR